jgi:hypothetical protein
MPPFPVIDFFSLNSWRMFYRVASSREIENVGTMHWWLTPAILASQEVW